MYYIYPNLYTWFQIYFPTDLSTIVALEQKRYQYYQAQQKRVRRQLIEARRLKRIRYNIPRTKNYKKPTDQ